MSKFMVLVHASKEAEEGKMPTTEEFAEMGAFNKPHVESGVILDANGFLASSKGVRLNFSEGSGPTVKQGPFELENLVAGFWIVKMETIDDVVEWAKGIPFKKGSVEIRKIAGPEDFGEAFTDKLRAEEEEMRKKQAEKKQ